jgi:hypothetical protein
MKKLQADYTQAMFATIPFSTQKYKYEIYRIMTLKTWTLALME